MQRELAVLGDVKPHMAGVPQDVLDLSKTMLNAVALCVQLSRISDATICRKLGIDKGHWSRIMRGRASLPLNKLVPLMELCGNYVPLQFLAREMGFVLRRDVLSQEEAEILARAEQIKARQAA